MFHQNRSANADRRATLVCFVTNFFPKLMRCFLSYCIKQNGLTNKYCNNTRNPSILTPTELLLIQELPSIENFTIHLCYKFITLEELLPKPSNGWGKFPDEKRLEVEDDIERIRHAINEIITTNDDECTKNYFVKFLYKLERIIQRVQIALGNKTLYVIFKSFLIKNIDTEVVLGEFINVDIIRGSNIEHIKLQDRERYSKISAVITEFFPKLLRNILQSKVSPSMLYNLCIKPGVHWNYSEKSQVNTLKSSNNYESLDASMLYKLFRTFTCVDEPTQGWGKLPTNYDLSISDDIERIRILRNKSAHRCDTRIDQTEFENQFLQFHDITRRISIDHENELTAIETDSLDHKRQIELEKALHELEDIKERFEKDYVRYYWGNKFEMKIKDIRQRIKTGKVIIGKGTIAIDIELPNVDDTETRAKILNEFKDEVNEGDLKIKFIAAITGSLIIHADIDTNALITNTSLQEELTSFMTRILNTGRLQITSFQWIDAVIFLAEGNMELDLNSSVAKSLRLQFNVDMDVFETDEQFESEMNACMQRTIKNLNGKGFIGEVTAIVDSEQSDNTEETLRMDTCRSSPIIDKSVEFENWDKIVSGTSGKVIGKAGICMF
ncbi:uncharacterized protein LOC143077017 [Mytilus galloprovincialis]|uniref:uncharacterized protein LOC143077017 n=1 Tax=Mytilus galloprovincialis TaxID=29158 RepID=UPI003F7C0DAE